MDKVTAEKALNILNKRISIMVAQVSAGRLEGAAGMNDILSMVNYLEGVVKPTAPTKIK